MSIDEKRSLEATDRRPSRSLSPTAVIALAIIVTGILIAIHMLISAPEKVITGTANGLLVTGERAADLFTRYLGSKDAFNATFGPIVSEQRLRRLQFFQRDQVCLFRIVRYRGPDGINHDHTEFYKKEADKRDLSGLITWNQYCEWQAKGTFEFDFYIDMSDLSRWEHTWDRTRRTLTLYPPDIEANTPAELEPLTYTCIADSITIDEDYTKQQLEKAIPRLKVQLANDQKAFMYSEARSAIEGYYQDLFRRIPELLGISPPEIIVIFPRERKK